LKNSTKTSPDGWNLSNSYTELPSAFFTRQAPSKVPAASSVLFNHTLALSLGLDTSVLAGATGTAIFAGNTLPAGADPIAQAYAGSQFGHFNILGDGRAILLGEQITPTGMRYDIQLKGAGVTAYSRRGDGRAALGPMLREYIISEAMHALGISTTRSLAVVTSGEQVYRSSVLPGAIMTRVAASHIRVGTFQLAASQLAASREDTGAVKALADYTLQRHFPELVSSENPYLALLQAVSARQAKLLSQWMLVGFIHGVMNTDNMSICGETIDYGPCAFMDSYDPATVFSSIDEQGRYAFANQPPIAQWNLARFAETLLPLVHPERAEAVKIAEDALQNFATEYEHHWLSGMRAKLGLFDTEEADRLLVDDLLACMQKHSLDYINTFRDLAASLTKSEVPSQLPMLNAAEFIDWHRRWLQRLSKQNETQKSVIELMLASTPAVIARNHQVEAAISAAEAGDFSITSRLLQVLADPFNDSDSLAEYKQPAPPAKLAYQTYCGT
jgi:uncharacterized protein YdiU (UPF0061 family)